MKHVKLIHNPTAGEGDSTISTIISILKAEGYKCSVSSTEEIERGKIMTEGADFIVVAGGDGTVRKTALSLVNQPVSLAILPIGTANNIGKALEIRGECEEIIADWKDSSVIKFDIGEVLNLPDENYFLEGMGFGVFPKLMKAMHGASEEGQKKMEKALDVLHDIILNYHAEACVIEIDGEQMAGNYLLCEIMNIRSIGPNLQLVPRADPGDGELDVVLIEDSQRERLARYIKTKLMDTSESDRGEYNFFTTKKAKHIRMTWSGKDFHVDDRDIILNANPILEVSVIPGGLSFLAPKAYSESKL